MSLDREVLAAAEYRNRLIASLDSMRAFSRELQKELQSEGADQRDTFIPIFDRLTKNASAMDALKKGLEKARVQEQMLRDRLVGELSDVVASLEAVKASGANVEESAAYAKADTRLDQLRQLADALGVERRNPSAAEQGNGDESADDEDGFAAAA